MTKLEEFYEEIVHTDVEEVPKKEAQTAAEFLLQMAALRCNVYLQFNTQLYVTADTPLGQFHFCLSSDETDLVVSQVL